jgi:uncharacterized protein (TIRG00374 family)
VRRAVGLGLIVIERLLDLVIVSATIVVTGMLLARQARASALQVAAAILLAGLVATIAAISIRRWREGAIRFFGAVTHRVVRVVRAERFVDIARRIFDVWDDVFASPRILARYLLVSAVAWLADFVKLWVLLRAAGANVELLTVLFVYPVSLIAGILSLVPFSEGVVGVAAVALLNRLAGVELETATAAVAVDRVVATMFPVLLSALFTVAYGIRRRKRP